MRGPLMRGVGGGGGVRMRALLVAGSAAHRLWFCTPIKIATHKMLKNRVFTWASSFELIFSLAFPLHRTYVRKVAATGQGKHFMSGRQARIWGVIALTCFAAASLRAAEHPDVKAEH